MVYLPILWRLLLGRRRNKTSNVVLATSVSPETKQLILGIRHSDSFPEISCSGVLLDSMGYMLSISKDDAAFCHMASASIGSLASYLEYEGRHEAAQSLSLLASVIAKINGAELEERSDWRCGSQPKAAVHSASKIHE